MVVVVQTSLILLAAYGVLGLIFALAFHGRGLPAVDTNTRGAGVGFRWIITPGIVALWPLLAWRWRTAHGRGSFPGGPDAPVPARRLRAAHALAWKALATTAPVIVAAALWSRPPEAPRSRIPLPSPSPSSSADSLRSAPQNLLTNRVRHAAVF
ncbi:MAG: hypothetical protein JNL10_08830 [Verrucomicrobiales bacterium]|nr:hypothetical protein [Verrucomicrobiales bacterium]